MQFIQNGIHAAFGNQNVICDDGLVVFPPAAQGERLGGLLAVYVKGYCEGCAQLGLHTEQRKCVGVGRGLIGSLGRQATFDRVTVHPVRLLGIGIADFYMTFVEGRIKGHAQKAAQTIFFDKWVFFELVVLFFGQILKAAVAESADLTEVGLFKRVVDGHCNGEQRGKEHGGEQDCQNGNQIARTVGTKRTKGQAPNTSAVCNMTHGAHLRILPSSMRMIRSDSCAISSLWVIITMV